MDLKPFKFLLGLLCSALSAEASPPRPQYSANHYYYYYLMGRYHLNIGNAEDAVEYLETARLLNKESPIIARELSELYYIGGNYEAALQHASAVYGAMPDDLEFLEYYAELLIKNERKDRAAEILKDMIEAAPDNEGYRFRMAAIYEHSGDLKSAVNQYMEVIKRDKGNIFARIALADVYLSFEEYSAAITHYKSAIKHGADAKDVYLQIGRIYHRQGKSRKAVRYVQRAINESPEDWIAHATLADIYIENEEIDKAEEVLKTLVEKYPNEYASQMRLGIFYMETDESDRAKEVFSKLSELFPEEYSVWLFLSFMQEHLGSPADAEKSLNKALEINETDQAYFHLGVVKDQLGEAEESYAAFKKAIELNPNHAPAKNYLGYLWVEADINLQEAKELIKSALELEPDNGAYLDSLGWLYFRLSRYEEALKYLKMADELVDDPVIKEHLGDTYIKLDDIPSALEAYTSALSLDTDSAEIKEKIQKYTN